MKETLPAFVIPEIHVVFPLHKNKIFPTSILRLNQYFYSVKYFYMDKRKPSLFFQTEQDHIELNSYAEAGFYSLLNRISYFISNKIRYPFLFIGILMMNFGTYNINYQIGYE